MFIKMNINKDAYFLNMQCDIVSIMHYALFIYVCMPIKNFTTLLKLSDLLICHR